MRFLCGWLWAAGLVLSAPLPAAAQANATPTRALPSLTLDQAITRAEANEPLFAAALAEQKALALDRTNAQAAFLPTAVYHNQAIYTQANGSPGSRIGQTTFAPSPIFIANNSVREYVNQGSFNEVVGFRQVAALRLADANAARASALLEIGRRGLVGTVVSLFYGVAASGQKLEVARAAKAEADRFLDIAQKREEAREAAHADVLKAQLQQQQRERELADAVVLLSRANTELGVLLFPDPTAGFTVEATPPPMLPDRAGIEQRARENNPDLRGALAAVQIASAQVYTSRAALAPDLALNVTYGIDATNFGVNGPEGIRNLGYSMGATLDIPVWDWLSTERRIKASHLREGAAKVALEAAQRRLLANLSEFYTEAQVAGSQLALLEATVATARESLRLINLRYVDGESTVLEVADAENTLLAAQTARIDGEVRYRLALANLQTLTGKL